MSDQLAHAVIVSGADENSYEKYLRDITTEADEIIRIEEHPNQSKTSSGIYIEDVRNLQTTVRTAKRGIRTIIILNDAAKLTVQAQNALLKLLEEPRKGLHFVLLTSSPAKLLQTVRSRCQTVTLKTTTDSVTLPDDMKARILFMAGESPSEQQRLASDPKYFQHRSKLFALAKEFIGGDPYIRLTIVKQVGDKRDVALEFIEVILRMYNALITRNFTPRLRDEATLFLDIDQSIRANANSKLQLLRVVV